MPWGLAFGSDRVGGYDSSKPQPYTTTSHSKFHLDDATIISKGLAYQSIAKGGIKLCMKNRYSKSSKLSEGRIRAVVKCFAADLTVLQTAWICGVNRNTVNRIYRGLRECIFEASATAFFSALWKSTKSSRRVKGNRGAYGKTTVWHLRVLRPGLHRDRARQGHMTIRGRIDSFRSRRAPSVVNSADRLARLQRAGRPWVWSPSRSTTRRTSEPGSISMALKASGVWPKCRWLNSKACQNTPFTCT